MATEKKQIKTRFYTALRPVADTDKVPPQAKLIMSTIVEAGGRVERDALLQLLSRKPEDGGLKTNQTADRILGFYRPKLTEIGILKEETETTEIDVEVPDKPEKPAKVKKEAAESTDDGNAPAAQVEKTKHGKGKQTQA